MQQQKKSVKKSKLFFEYSYAINGLLLLSHRELEVFSLVLEYFYKVRNEGIQELAPIGLRKLIMNKTAINRHNLSKYMLKFERSGLIHREGLRKPYSMKNELLPIINDNTINLEYIISCE